MKNRMALAIFCAAGFLLQACGHSDLTKDVEYHFTIAGTTWKLKAPVAVVKIESDFMGYVSSDAYESAYRHGTANPNEYGGQFPVVALLSKGTTIRIERLVGRGGDVGGCYVEFSVQSGPDAGKAVEAPNEFFTPNKFLDAKQTKDTWDLQPEMLEK